MLYLGDEFILFRGVLGDLGRHAHAAPAFVGSLEHCVSIEWPVHEQPFKIAFVPAGLMHKPDFGGAMSTVMYLRLDSGWAARTKRHYAGDTVTEVSCPIFREAFFASMRAGSASAPDMLLSALDHLLPAASTTQAQDQRVTMMFDRSRRHKTPRSQDFPCAQTEMPAIRTSAPVEGTIKRRGFSASRLRHLFVAETSVPYRRHRIWTRLENALALALSGRSLTEAAHEAGFSDSSHFTRAFRDMFGLPPSAVVGSISSFADMSRGHDEKG